MAGRMPESDLESEDENVGPETALRSKTKYKVTVKEVKRPENCCSCLPQRYVTCVFIVFGFITCYLMRVSVFLALTEMTFKIPNTKPNNSQHQYCPPEPQSEKAHVRAEFNWDQHMQHDIIKSIYIGYIIAHVPAGMLSDTFGGKHVFGGGILMSSILSLSFPHLARFSPYAFMAGRVIQGFGQGVMFPSTSALVAKWAPPNERSAMTGIVQSGIMLGNSLGYITSGIILDSFHGWEPIFYVCGTIGLIWCLGWYTLCYSSPPEHPYITDKEKEMILTQQAMSAKQKPKHTPWRSILTSLPFISAVTINFGHAWAVITMVNELPTYTGKVLNFNVKKSGLYSALPHLAMIPSSLASGYLSDFIVKRKIQSITNNRKMFSFLSLTRILSPHMGPVKPVCPFCEVSSCIIFIGSASGLPLCLFSSLSVTLFSIRRPNTLPIPFLLGASYAGCDRTLVIVLFMTMMFFKGLIYASARANPVDLSPNYAGVLMGIMNGVGAFAGLISPIFVPIFITGDGSVQEWRNVFFMTATLMLTTSVPYLFLGSGELQSWNNIAQPSGDPQQTTSSGNPDSAQEAKA